MQTKHLCVMIHILTKGEVGALLNWLKPSSKIFLLTIPRWCFFCGSFMLFLSCLVMLSCTPFLQTNMQITFVLCSNSYCSKLTLIH